MNHTTAAKAYGNHAAHLPLEQLSIPRRAVMPHDVSIEILYCGVCHSDLHTARGEWGAAHYPCVPGHEIVGRVTAVGNHVSKFKPGDLAAVGCMVDSCRECAECRNHLEQYCDKGATYTYNSADKHLGTYTFGGYSDHITVDENYVLHIPKNLDSAAAAPLLCAGITTYSPLKHWQAGPGKKVGVVGIGGLGHMALKLANAMGAHVTAFTTSPSKADEARRLGAHEVVVSTNAAAMHQQRKSLDLIIDTVSAAHDVNEYLQLLRLDGALVLVGLPSEALPVQPFKIVAGRRSFSGSSIGGILETQEMLDFCGQHNIVSDIEMINIQQINEAYERLVKGDVRYRFVIDMASLKADRPS